MHLLNETRGKSTRNKTIIFHIYPYDYIVIYIGIISSNGSNPGGLSSGHLVERSAELFPHFCLSHNILISLDSEVFCSEELLVDNLSAL